MSRKAAHLGRVVSPALIVGELQLAKRDLLSHPMGSGVRGIRMHVHPVSC